MGPSMNPVLKTGDVLNISTYGSRKIRVGDVIVFNQPEDNYNIVHRIVSINPQGIKTKGDNNLNMDQWILSPDDIIGRVVSVQRKNENLKIHGRSRGRIFAFMFWILKRIDFALSMIIHPIYRGLTISGMFLIYCRFLPEIRILAFNRPKGKELYLLMGNRIIGRHSPEYVQWRIERPFRLFINEASLPT